MHTSILLALWAGLSFILYKIVSHVLIELHYRREAKSLGCEDAYKFKLWDVQGIRNVSRMIAADKRCEIPQYLKGRVDNACAEEGKILMTFANTVLGVESIFTNDPKNVQAVLATQFKDFGLGHLRNSGFSQLLGNGVVSYYSHITC